MSKSSGVQSSGVGVSTILFWIFVVLKLLKIEPVASWSWWWVFAPIWAPIVLVLSIVGLYVIISSIVKIAKGS